MPIWEFLSDPAKREVLAFLGGGLVVVCGGLWTAVTFFAKPVGGGSAGGGTSITHGLSGWPLVALVTALAGAVVLVAAVSGPRVTATDRSVGFGGDNTGTIDVQ